MRQLLLICVMLLLPAQWTWAAAARYCTHEVGTAAEHFGHHEHQHRTAAGDVSKDTTKVKSMLAVDADCEVCQLGGAQCLLHEVDVAPPHAKPNARFEYLVAGSSHVPPGLERPDRPLAA